MTDTVLMPDGGRWTLIEPQATHRLTGGPHLWIAPGVESEWSKPDFRINLAGWVCYLRHNAAAKRYEGGGWPHAAPTGFTMTPADKDLVLTVWRVEAEVGPHAIPGVDGPCEGS